MAYVNLCAMIPPSVPCHGSAALDEEGEELGQRAILRAEAPNSLLCSSFDRAKQPFSQAPG